MIKGLTGERVFVALVLAIIFFFGVYRINDTLFFYADQGADARRVWTFLNGGRAFLAGQETSIGNLVRIGPLYYYLLAPLYHLGRGDPVIPMIFLVLIWVLSIYLLYRFSKKVFGNEVALLTLVLTGTSHYMTVFSRWLSNANPAFFLGILMLLSMHQIMTKKGFFWWLVSAFLIGLFFHFEAAAGFFYLFSFAIFSYWQRKQGFNLKVLVLMSIVFLSTFIPLLIHNARNENMLFKGLWEYFIEREAFALGNLESIKRSFGYGRITFRRLFFPGMPGLSIFWLSTIILVVSLQLKRLLTDKYFKLLLILTGAPFTAFYFFQDGLKTYYFSAFFAPLFLIISVAFSRIAEKEWGKILLFAFLTSFLIVNLRLTYDYLNKNADADGSVSFKNQKEAVSWIAERAVLREVDVKIYVPDKIVIDRLDYGYPYRYLLLSEGYYAVNRQGECIPEDENISPRFYFETFFVLKEDDPFSERMQAWLDCHKIGQTKLLESARFGGVTVEKRSL